MGVTVGAVVVAISKVVVVVNSVGAVFAAVVVVVAVFAVAAPAVVVADFVVAVAVDCECYFVLPLSAFFSYHLHPKLSYSA